MTMYDPFNPFRDLAETPLPDDWHQMTQDEREQYMASHAAGGCLSLVVTLLIGLAAYLILGGCTATPKIVTVPEIHERWHHTADTIRETDSIIDRQTTLIREVDSATMAQYGIQMKEAQRAWLIDRAQWQRQISALQHTTTDTVTVRDSLPVPYEVTKEVKVEKQLTAWQRFRLNMANIMLCLLAVAFAVWVWRTK